MDSAEEWEARRQVAVCHVVCCALDARVAGFVPLAVSILKSKKECNTRVSACLLLSVSVCLSVVVCVCQQIMFFIDCCVMMRVTGFECFMRTRNSLKTFRFHHSFHVCTHMVIYIPILRAAHLRASLGFFSLVIACVPAALFCRDTMLCCNHAVNQIVVNITHSF
jgi:hypothetical protein